MLKNKNVVITGASAGIGLACAEVFAEAGANLILIARRKEKLNDLADTLQKAHNIKIQTIQCDVRNRKESKSTVDDILAGEPVIDILINNAGLARGLDKIQEGNFDNWDEMIDTNIKGLLNFTRFLLPSMVERGDGMVINIASIAGREVYPMGNVYCASKAAVRSISKGIAIDLNGTGIRVCNIDPGLVETEFASVRFHGDLAKAEKVYEGYTPLTGRDVAESALFAATRPKHVMIQDILITPTDQATATMVNKQ